MNHLNHLSETLLGVAAAASMYGCAQKPQESQESPVQPLGPNQTLFIQKTEPRVTQIMAGTRADCARAAAIRINDGRNFLLEHGMRRAESVNYESDELWTAQQDCTGHHIHEDDVSRMR